MWLRIRFTTDLMSIFIHTALLGGKSDWARNGEYWRYYINWLLHILRWNRQVCDWESDSQWTWCLLSVLQHCWMEEVIGKKSARYGKYWRYYYRVIDFVVDWVRVFFIKGYFVCNVKFHPKALMLVSCAVITRDRFVSCRICDVTICW